MERKNRHSMADPRCDRACFGALSGGTQKNSSRRDAGSKGTSPTIRAAEKSRGMQSSWNSNYGGVGGGGGKEINACGYKSSGSLGGKSEQSSEAGVDAGGDGSQGSRDDSLPNSRRLSQRTSPSPSTNCSVLHSRSSSSNSCPSREPTSSDSTDKSQHLNNTCRASTVVDYQNSVKGGSDEFQSHSRRARPGESVSVRSFGNIYRSLKSAVVNKDLSSSDEASRSNALPASRANGVVCEVAKNVTGDRHILGFGGVNYGHGSIINGSNLKRLSPYVNSIKNGEGPQSCPTRGGNGCCKRMEELKNAGNEEYRRGRFTEAIPPYDKAISLCPGNAACHNNKAAALEGLGRYEEAVGECLEAISCDPSYLRAHHRLGNLYTRLGRLEDAKWHFKLSGQHPSSETMQKIHQLETHLVNMRYARSSEDWSLVLMESTLAIDIGADASIQVLAFKAEALLKLHKAEEALELVVLARESGGKKSSGVHHACLLIIEIQIYMYLGRFEYGVMTAECLINLECKPESLLWLQKARAAADARKTGNELYKAGKYYEACTAYGHGLEYAPTNSVLLCNRAACRCKLGQWDMAVRDCNAALQNRPGHTKALLRRAHAYAKLEYWEESLKDYKVLNQEMPDDISISQSLLQVQVKLKREHCEDDNLLPGGQVTHLNSYTLFLKFIETAGLALLQYFMKSDDRCKQLSPLISELSQRYPSWRFIKVDVEENPDWAKFECIKIVPIFIIYKDGHKLREICKPDQQVLEHALKFHSTLSCQRQLAV